MVPDLPREELAAREREPAPDRDPLARDEPVGEELVRVPLVRVLLVRDPPPA